MTHCQIAIISPQHDLSALGDHPHMPVQTGVDGGLGAAGADGLDLGNGVGYLEKTAAALKEMAEEVGAQAKAKDGDIVIIDDGAQGIHLLGGKELAFVRNDHIVIGVLRLVQSQEIHVPPHGQTFGLQTDAGSDGVGPVTGVQGGLDQPHLHAALLVVELGNERLGGLGGPHSAVLEIELCHIPPRNF